MRRTPARRGRVADVLGRRAVLARSSRPSHRSSARGSAAASTPSSAADEVAVDVALHHLDASRSRARRRAWPASAPGSAPGSRRRAARPPAAHRCSRTRRSRGCVACRDPTTVAAATVIPVTQAGVEDISYDPFEDHREIPFGLLADLRRSCPVAKVPSGLFYLARYDDVVPAFREWKTFASRGRDAAARRGHPPEEQIISEAATGRLAAVAAAHEVGDLAGQGPGHRPVDHPVGRRPHRRGGRQGRSDLVEDLTGPVLPTR